MKITKIIGAMAIMAMASQAHAISFVIDHFDDNPGTGNISHASPDAGPTVDTQVGTTAVGADRDVVTSSTGGGNNLDFNIGATTVSGDSLEISNGAGVTGVVKVVWDGTGVSVANGGAGAAGLGGVDFTAGGINTYIRVNVLNIDLTTTVSLTLVDTLANTYTTPAALFGGPGVFLVSLNDFFIGGNVNVASIDSLTMTLTGATAWDATFDLIETGGGVPVPAPMALIGLGLVGLAMRRRTA